MFNTAGRNKNRENSIHLGGCPPSDIAIAPSLKLALYNSRGEGAEMGGKTREDQEKMGATGEEKNGSGTTKGPQKVAELPTPGEQANLRKRRSTYY